ncbi:LOW QUALITY PROTEIN: fibronectin type 3 and ankyrin repeat domains protein 1 [Morphnus guianensis]
MFGKCLEYLKEHMRLSFLFRGCATQHVVGGCEPRMSYRYLKVTSPKGAFAYSPVISVFPTRNLMLATFAGHLDMVMYLRSQGASWEARDLGGHMALHQAADGGHCHGIEWMIADGCNVGFSSIHFAEKTALSKM